MKICRVCKLNKPLNDFPREKRKKDGRTGTCNLCTNVIVKARGCSVPAPDSKTCLKCGLTKPISEFNKNAWRVDGYETRCQACKYPQWRAYQIEREYGISMDEYESMFQVQKGVCAICGRPPKKKALSVDHDHQTGRVRGLLCWPCNRFLGHMKDDADLLRHMISYLAGPVSV